MSRVDVFVNKAVSIAEDWTHGYDQVNRWGPDYDCSSLVYTCAKAAGYDVPDSGTRYTGMMLEHFAKAGFVVHKFDGRLDDLDKGDILLNTLNHVAVYIGDGKLVEASGNELGGIAGGKPGDQTGREIAINPVYNYPWNYVLSPPAEDGGNSMPESNNELANKVWAYRNKRLESKDAYSILRECRDLLKEIRGVVKGLESKK